MKEKSWPAGLFKRNALMVACEELEMKFNADIDLTTVKKDEKLSGMRW